jgi:hypothetical protein
MPSTQTENPAVALRQMMIAYQVSQAIYAAAVLGVADHLAEGPQGSDVLANRIGTDEDALCRLLRSLAGVGVFAEVAPRTFGLTPMAALLRTGTAGSQRALAMFVGQDWLWRPWGRLVESVRTGRDAFGSVFGTSFYEYLDRNPEIRVTFQRAMLGAIGRAAVADSYDFSGAGTVADIGGGHGGLIATILTTYPTLDGILFERPSVLAEAEKHLRSAGVIDRCGLVAGDFFTSVEGGADTYVLSQILHDWDDEAAHLVLSNCRKVMRPAGKLLIVERVLAEGGEPQPGPLGDLNMLVLFGGRERTAMEYEALLSKADFALERIVPAGEGWSVLVARPGESSAAG